MPQLKNAPRLERYLRLSRPMMRGEDVRRLQVRLMERMPELARTVKVADGLFGPATHRAVRDFQTRQQDDFGLAVDGVVGPKTWTALFSARDAEASAVRAEMEQATRAAAGSAVLDTNLESLTQPHRRFGDSALWHLTATGVAIDGHEPVGTGGRPESVRRLLEHEQIGPAVMKVAGKEDVPLELILATICTESAGGQRDLQRAIDAMRREPGYRSDALTPHKVSVGLMQTLISTARETLRNPAIDAQWLRFPENALSAGTAYIRRQAPQTLLDPPVVACAYNAGSVYLQRGADNRWKMRQYPIGTGKHADRFVQFFNDCFRLFADDPQTLPKDDTPSLFRKLNG